MTTPHRTTTTTALVNPLAPRNQARRLRTTVVMLAAAAITFALMTGVARADGNIPNCAHPANGPTLYTDLGLANAGTSETQWLYRWNGSAWQYTYRYDEAWSHGNGYWTNTNGNYTTSLGFGLRSGSGYYKILERIVGPSGPATFWMPYYYYRPGGYYGSYCTA